MAMYEMTVRVEIAEEAGEYQDLEKQVQEASRTAGNQLLTKMMQDEEAKQIKKQKLRRKDRRIKTYQTLLGEIVIERWRVIKAGQTWYPIDRWMGLKKHQRVSPGYQAELLHHVVQKPYAKASEDTARVTGIKRTAYANWKLVQSIAEERRQVKVKPRNWKRCSLPILRSDAPDECPIMAIDPDGTYIRPRRKEDKRHEVKMAVLYTAKRPVKKSKGKLRWELGQKQVVMGTVNGGANALFNNVTDKAITDYGAHAKTKVIAHGDGDPWIKRIKTDYWAQALLRLDPYHAFEKIRQATDVETIPKDWIKAFYQNPDSLIAKLKVFKKQLAASDDQERVDTLITYFQNNREGILPSRVSKQVKAQHPRMYLRGSGSIESNIDWAIGARFKRSRMMWSKVGINNLLLLRTEFLNSRTGFKKVQVPKDHYCSDPVEEVREFLREF